MQTSSLLHSLPLTNKKGGLNGRKYPSSSTSSTNIGVVVAAAARRSDPYDHHRDYNGKLVDENMIVLRMRIQETRMAEKKDEPHLPPSDWMEWEKKYYYESYDSDIFEAIGYLQLLLMETRPSLALAMAVLIALSVGSSITFVIYHLVDLVKGVLN